MHHGPVFWFQVNVNYAIPMKFPNTFDYVDQLTGGERKHHSRRGGWRTIVEQCFVLLNGGGREIVHRAGGGELQEAFDSFVVFGYSAIGDLEYQAQRKEEKYGRNINIWRTTS